MTTIYAVGIGHNVPDEELVPIEPQPSCQGITPTRSTPSASGDVWDEGPHVHFVFDGGLNDGVDVRAILLQFGLNTESRIREVTIRTRDAFYNDVRVNGLAVRPVPGGDLRWSAFFPRMVILVKDLEEPAV